MGNAPIQIGLKCHKTTYQHGESMTGTVFVSVTSVNPTIQSYQGIRLSLSGHENTEVRIRESQGSGNDRVTNIRTERESTMLFHVQVPLTTFASPLRVAKYEFPFAWKLPDDTPLPSSFRHANCGHDGKGHAEVRYTLSASLVPQEQQQPSSFFLASRIIDSATNASQTIQLVGAPTRSIPEPLHLAEERTVINGLCCCWNQGHVSLGWEADSIVLSPSSPCHLQIWGSNASALPVHNLRVQLIQTIQWHAGQEFQGRQNRNDSTILVDYKVDLSHLPQWNPVHHKGGPGDYSAIHNNNNNNNQHGLRPVATSFQVPPDVLDSYQGLNCTIEHTLTVSALTRFLATTPSVPFQVHVQRRGDGATASPAEMPLATAFGMEEPDYQDLVLPADWAPDETVPVIHLTEIAALHDESGGKATTMATAEAVLVDPVRSITSEYDEDALAFARPAEGFLAPSAPTEDDFDMNRNQPWNTVTPAAHGKSMY